MKLNYDNLEDAKVKLVNTFCMFKGKAVLVKQLAMETIDDHNYAVYGSFMSSGRPFECHLNDPDFNCSQYNIGYVNATKAAAWYYRVPMKQYKQGLRYDQLRMKYSQRAFADVNFQSGKAVCSMLENSYPSFQSSAELVKLGEANIMAFHKNFAMTLDKLHDDLIIEYKGLNIGFTSNLKDFTLMGEYSYLMEALKEAVGE